MIYNKDITIPVNETVSKYEIVDSHLHFLDFTQDSDGFPSLVKAMDQCGVSEAVVFGMPNITSAMALNGHCPLSHRLLDLL